MIERSPLPLCVISLSLVAACGARTGLDAPSSADSSAVADASVDVVLQRPSCLDERALSPGEIRFRVPRITGHPAVAPDGTIFSPTVEPEGGRGLAAIDPCGRVRWRATGWVGTPQERNLAQRPYARVLDDGQVLLTNSVGAGVRHGAFRFLPDGSPRGALAFEQRLSSFVGIPSGSGPVAITYTGQGTRFELARFSLEGARVTLASDFRNGEECAMDGALVACWDRAFDTSARRMLWDGPSDEIIDGTRRHVVGPAVHNDVMYALLFGVRTYVLAAKSARTGRELWRRTLESSSSGQTGFVAGAPVVAPNGDVLVFLKLAGATGTLRTFSSDGAPRRTRSMAAGPQDFLHDATTAIDRAGAVYLATGVTVTAYDGDAVRWSRAIQEGLSRAAPVISPFGDLYVITNSDELVAIAADSPGEATTGWPTARGGSRNRNAR